MSHRLTLLPNRGLTNFVSPRSKSATKYIAGHESHDLDASSNGYLE